MTEASWTKNSQTLVIDDPAQAKRRKFLFMLGGVVIVAAIALLVVNAMRGNTQLYKTVGEFYAEQERLTGRDLRVAGLVIGDSIQFTQIDATTSRLEFDIVDDLNNPTQRLRVIAINEPMPDLLQHEAEAMVEGYANEEGEFIANSGGLFLKCPTRYEELDPAGHPGKLNES